MSLPHPDFDDIALLANWDGVDGDTSYTPEIGSDTLQFLGGAELDTDVLIDGNPTVLLDGSAGRVQWGAPADVQFLHDQTETWMIEWFASAVSASGDCRLLSTTSGGCGIDLYYRSNGLVYLFVTDSTGWIVAYNTPSAIMPFGVGRYFKLTFNHTTRRLCLRINALRLIDITVPVATGPFNTNAALTFGNTPDGAGGMQGSFGPVRVTRGAETDAGEFVNTGTLLTAPFPAPVPPLGARVHLPLSLVPAARLLNDFSSLIVGRSSRYVMRLTGDPVVEVPVNSWQATIQTDRENFLATVIPAASDVLDALAERQGTEQFVIYRRTEFKGVSLEAEMARAGLDTVRVDRGPYRFTVSIQGFTGAFDDVRPGVVTLRDVRSVSQTLNGGTRVRCGIDWFLRPGQVCEFGDVSFTADFINYYATTAGDAYMDVGSRG